MTPCEVFGYKVGDKFICKKGWVGFTAGQTVPLYKDDRSIIPLFSGTNSIYNECDGNSGTYMHLDNVIKIGEQEDMNKDFTKDMLRTGMRVVHRNGEVGIVFKDISTIGYKDGFDCLKGWDENLYILERDWDGCANWDIMKVYDGYIQHTNLINFNKLGELIWERKEETEHQKQITELQEIIKNAQIKLEELKEGIK